MLIKVDEAVLTRIGFWVVTSLFVFSSAKQIRRKIPIQIYGNIRSDRDRIIAKFKQYKLTSREMEVALLLCERFRHKEIADKLFISERTVNKHVENIFGKVDVKKRSDLISTMIELDMMNKPYVV